MIYSILKSLITKGSYEKEDISNKLDIFMTFDRITLEQYEELSNIVNRETNGEEII